MGGATALAVGCLAILEDASTQAVAACAFTNYNACVTLGGSGSNVKITRVGDAYDGDSVSLRYGSLEDTVTLTVTVNGLEGELSYRWYRCDESAPSSSMTPIDGATSVTFDAPAPIRKDEEVRYTCGVTAGGETYFPDKVYTIIRFGEVYHRDLSDRAYTSGMTNGGISVYMSYSIIRWLLQSSDDAYMSVEYYSVPSKDSYENATLLCRWEPFPCVKLDPTGNTGYLDSYGFPLELGETKYFYSSEAITSAHIHEHEFTEKRPEADYLKTPATCTEKAVYYYACACGEKGSETYTYGEPTPHGETELRNYREAAVGVVGYTGDTYCKACGEKLAEGEIIPALPEPETETETDAPETETDAPETETHATTGGCGCGSGCGSSISMVSLMSIVLLVAAPGFLRARRKEEEV